MFSKSNLLATLVGTIVMFFLGYLIWGIATADFFEEHSIINVMKEVPDLGMIALANLIAVFALSTLYGKWARGHHSLSQGFQFGAWIGVFVGIGMGLLNYGTTEFMDLIGYMAEAVLDIIFYGILGAVIAFMYQKTAAKE
ncbi:hypothetical protein [Flagellimonas aequoris]|uniref:DUF1761 domain-containing protein n=1 Tax=Flagellimonas aequoris TaxID=2306997 RepID=A0A418N795_9FLAO|nr:hypothetical protein [Allomuricauda aequoris]RIV70633.1 hypothetical protein D2U88_09710 [Allomuricauda aequoris]TXK02068.1 hypothetical protein FQ019_09635 [Allomuricauda aequoris]